MRSRLAPSNPLPHQLLRCVRAPEKLIREGRGQVRAARCQDPAPPELRVLKSHFLAVVAFVLSLAASDTANATQAAGNYGAWSWTAPRTTVTTAFGAVCGNSPDGHSLVWKGIPYAAPPVGALRWKAPVDPVPWSGVRLAMTDPDVCFQQKYDSYWRPTDDFIGSEDCLYLNVYRPKTLARNLPVYVFIHGGEGDFGGIRDYDPRVLAVRGSIVVVTVQFRLNAFGFFTHPAMRASGTALDHSGNYATLDQIKALRWVKGNIAAFGGDPSKVVIGGQSNGAGCALELLLSPLARGLYRGAFLESTGGPAVSQAYADNLTDKTLDGLLLRDGNATNAAEAAAYREQMTDPQIVDYLRSKSALQILKARRDGTGPDGMGIMPGHEAIADGYVIPTASRADAIADGMWAQVPLLIGGTSAEWRAFGPSYGPAVKAISSNMVPSGTNTWADLLKVIGVGGQLALNDVFPTTIDHGFYDTIADIETRLLQAQGVDEIARSIKTAAAGAPVWVFRFDWAGGKDPALRDFATIFGAAHAMDIPFFQGSDHDAWDISFTAANQNGRVALQQAMMDYLASFVRTLNPNRGSTGLPRWPQWSPPAGATKLIVFDADLAHAHLTFSAEEQTEAAITARIAAARATYPQFAEIFQLFGLSP